jgi:hypothetical protein
MKIIQISEIFIVPRKKVRYFKSLYFNPVVLVLPVLLKMHTEIPESEENTLLYRSARDFFS